MVTPQEQCRSDFIDTVNHLESIAGKIGGLLGRNGVLTFPDHHKLSEGIFLSGWTYWETFLRKLIIEDLASDLGGFVQKDVTKFRVKGAPRRIAERVLQHPDHPKFFVDWDYGVVKDRADSLLSSRHRFTGPLPRRDELEKMKRIRNAIAHKSDRAWESFLKLVKEPPFSLHPHQRQGLTVGRFLTSHQWNGNRVMQECLAVHRQNALHLVP